MIKNEKLFGYLENLVKQSHEVFWIRSADYSRQLYINPAYEKVWGRSCESLYQNPGEFINTILPEDEQKLRDDIAKRDPDVTPGDKFFATYRIVRPDGEIRWIEDESFAIFDDNNIHIGFAGIAIDVTEKKKREIELRQAMHAAKSSDRAKSEFIANMSHDVKTPLAGIIAMTNNLSKELEDPEVVDNLKMMNKAGKQLLSFFENCLEMVKMEVAEVALNRENFNIREVIDGVAEVYEPWLYNKHIKFYVHFDRNLPTEIYASREGLRRIVLNLVSNALKFTTEGTVKITASLWQNPKDQHDNIKIEVSDTGMGIPEDKIGSIYERFTRVTPSYEGTFEGHGLGLHIVQRFIQLMGGEVSVETEVGKGSCFTVTFPFQEPQEGKTKAPKERVRANPDGKVVMKNSKFPTETILAVEDNDLAQRVIKSLLKKLGYAVEIAETPPEVFAKFEVGKYSLIFMDIGIPEMSGDEITRNIRRAEGAFGSRHIPIIGLTAHADEKTLQKCIDAGMNEVLFKPLTEEMALMVLKDYGGD